MGSEVRFVMRVVRVRKASILTKYLKGLSCLNMVVLLLFLGDGGVSSAGERVISMPISSTLRAEIMRAFRRIARVLMMPVRLVKGSCQVAWRRERSWWRYQKDSRVARSVWGDGVLVWWMYWRFVRGFREGIGWCWFGWWRRGRGSIRRFVWPGWRVVCWVYVGGEVGSDGGRRISRVASRVLGQELRRSRRRRQWSSVEEWRFRVWRRCESDACSSTGGVGLCAWVSKLPVSFRCNCC